METRGAQARQSNAIARRPRVIDSPGGRPDERDVSELCHDLRQPVNAIDTSAHYLLRLEKISVVVLRTASRIISSCARRPSILGTTLSSTA